MKEKLLELIKKIQSDRRLVSFDEAATKQAVILRILSYLNWDTFNIDEVHPEYSVSGRKVDYSLRYSNYNKVFIEVKKIGEDLEKHQEQLLNYSFQEGVKLAILTNGITWWFYLPLHEGSWEQRKFYTIEIYDQEAEDITQKFIDFLSKENVISGESINNAENIYRSRQKMYLIKDTLPRAWDKLVKEPDESIIELLAETTEKLCGHKPDSDTVEDFLHSYVEKIDKIGYEPSRPTVRTPPKTPVGPQRGESYTRKSIVSFTFKGTGYEVRTWKDMLMEICNIMVNTHRNSFEQVLNLVGRKRPYFTKSPDELRIPERINGTDIYVEVNLSANSIVKLSRDILALFGYGTDDLSIEVR
ncbi:restriction endonuclease subunit R [Methanosarcinales archaeon]|nr:MAG: restriction endonuclease subunit R [Methanosarcinales archaeon]